MKEDAIQNQYEFFVQRMGGPPLYSQRKGHPALIGRHRPFPVTHQAAERWLHHMQNALDDTPDIDQESKIKMMNLLNQETSSAQYILQQYGYVMGRIRTMTSEFETGTKGSKSKNNSSKAVESEGFVLWHMYPDMWYMELVLGGSKVLAGCDGKLVWRHTPWLGPHK